MRQLAVVLVAATVVASGVAPAAHAASAPTDAQRLARADRLERAGDLDGASVQLARLTAPTRAQRVHAAHVHAAAAAVAAAAALRRSGDDAQARAMLDAALTRLDAGADAVVRADVVARSAAEARRVTAAAVTARRQADDAATASLAKGDALRDRRQWDAAAAVYRSVATQSAGSIDETLRQTATVSQLQAEKETVEARPGPFARFWTDVWHGLRSALEWILKWLVPLALLALLMVLIHVWLWRRPRPDGITLSVVDTSDAMKDRRDRDQMLATALRDAMDDARGGGYVQGASYLDERRDLDGMAPPAVTAVSGSGPDSFGELSDKLEIDAGPLRISPLAFLPPIRRYLSRPRARTLCGTLRVDDSGAEMCLALHEPPEFVEDPSGRPVRVETPGPWLATSTDRLGARAAVIKEIAQKYVVESRQSYISVSWRSYVAYRKGLAALIAADDDLPLGQRKAQLELARSEFEQALSADQANLLARMRLGAVLRSMGRNPDAAAQFRRLVDDMLDVRRLPPHAASLVEAHPELLYFAALDAQVSLDKWSNRDRFRVTRTLAFLIDRLAVDEDRIPDVGWDGVEPRFAQGRWPRERLEREADRQRLLIVTLAAWSVSQLPRSKPGLDADPVELEACADLLRSVCDWIHGVDSEEPAVAVARRQAEATMRNAIARVARELRRWGSARREAEKALVLSPHLGDAHVTLAQVAMREDPRREDWSVEAHRHLKAALRISPEDARARFLLGELYEEIGEDAKAITHFQKLPVNPGALFRIGQIHEENDDMREAMASYVESQVRGPSCGRRAVALLSLVRTLNDEPRYRGWMYPHEGRVANATAEAIVEAAKTPEAREAAIEQRGEIRTAVRALVERAPSRAVTDDDALAA
jgi:tetratricopeptide (TPR) repeat protein